MSLVHPMLAGDPEGDFSLLQFPVMVSPKIDGIRASVQGGKLLSRNHKPIGNTFIRSTLEHKCFEGLDGELVVGDPFGSDTFLRSSGPVRARDGTPGFTFWVFDQVNMTDATFKDRRKSLADRLKALQVPKHVQLVPHTPVRDLEAMLKLEERYVHQGYEGVMTNNPNALYKQGRATLNKKPDPYMQALLKIKRFADAEAVILGAVEQMENTNEATADELGRSKRSTKKAGLVGKNTLGAFRVRGLNGPYKDVEFDVGTGRGWTDVWRRIMWSQRKHLVGWHLKYKFFLAGAKDAPRFPIGLAVQLEPFE